MAVGFIAAGTATANSGSGNPTAPGVPAGTLAGHIIICRVAAGDNVTVTVAGYTKFFEANAGSAARLTLAWKLATSSESAPTVTHTGGNTCIARLFTFSGVDNANPILGTPVSQANTGTATVTAPTFTPGATSAVVFAGIEELTGNTSGGPTWASYSGTDPTFAEIGDNASGIGSNEVSSGVAWGQSSGAATGSRTAVVSGEAATPTNVLGCLFALLPSVAAAASISFPAYVYAPMMLQNFHPKIFGSLLPLPGPLAAGGTIFQQALDATASATASLQRQVNKGLTASGPASATLAKLVSTTKTATASATASLAKQVNLTRSAAATATASLQKQANKVLSASATATASLTRQTGKLLTATGPATASLIKQVNKNLTANATATASLVAQKVILLTLTATASATASLQKQVLKPLTANATATASLIKQVGKRLTANATATASLLAQKVILLALTANATATASLQRTVLKPLTANATATATVTKSALKKLTANATATASLLAQKVILLVLTANATATASLSRQTGKVLTATSAATASVTKAVRSTLTALASATAELQAIPSNVTAATKRLRMIIMSKFGQW